MKRILLIVVGLVVATLLWLPGTGRWVTVGPVTAGVYCSARWSITACVWYARRPFPLVALHVDKNGLTVQRNGR